MWFLPSLPCDHQPGAVPGEAVVPVLCCVGIYSTVNGPCAVYNAGTHSTVSISVLQISNIHSTFNGSSAVLCWYT